MVLLPIIMLFYFGMPGLLHCARAYLFLLLFRSFHFEFSNYASFLLCPLAPFRLLSLLLSYPWSLSHLHHLIPLFFPPWSICSSLTHLNLNRHITYSRSISWSLRSSNRFVIPSNINDVLSFFSFRSVLSCTHVIFGSSRETRKLLFLVYSAFWPLFSAGVSLSPVWASEPPSLPLQTASVWHEQSTTGRDDLVLILSGHLQNLSFFYSDAQNIRDPKFGSIGLKFSGCYRRRKG